LECWSKQRRRGAKTAIRCCLPSFLTRPEMTSFRCQQIGVFLLDECSGWFTAQVRQKSAISRGQSDVKNKKPHFTILLRDCSSGRAADCSFQGSHIPSRKRLVSSCTTFWRSELCRTLFRQIVNKESHSLHYLLPPKRDTYLVSRLRSASTYPILRAKTNRFKESFLPYCLTNQSVTLCIICYCMLVCLCVCVIHCSHPALGCHTQYVMYVFINGLVGQFWR